MVEQVLAAAQIRIADGFGPPDGEVRWQDNYSFEQPDIGVRLIKLHGSINWRTFLVGSNLKLGVVDDPDRTVWVDKTGAALKQYLQQPSFLTGAGKLVSYNTGIFAEMTYRFHHALLSTEVVIMSGYGWGDVGVNLRIESWLDYKPQRKLVFLHTQPEDLCNRSVQLDRSYRHWEQSGKLIQIKSWLCDTSVDELMNRLHSG